MCCFHLSDIIGSVSVENSANPAGNTPETHHIRWISFGIVDLGYDVSNEVIC